MTQDTLLFITGDIDQYRGERLEMSEADQNYFRGLSCTKMQLMLRDYNRGPPLRSAGRELRHRPSAMRVMHFTPSVLAPAFSLFL